MKTRNKDKLLLQLEVLILILTILPIVSTAFFCEHNGLGETESVIAVLMSLIPFLIAVPFCLSAELLAGKYKCKKCGHEYIPEELNKILWAPHIGWTRYMKCPECGQWAWHKKELSDEKENSD